MKVLDKPKSAAAGLLILGLVITGIEATRLNRHNQDERQSRFAALAAQVADQVRARVQTYEYGLRGARGAIIGAGGGEAVTHRRFLEYSQSRDLKREFPGAMGFGFIRRVKPEQEAAFVRQVQGDRKDPFEIKQFTPSASERFVIQLIEPEEDNGAALGFDIASEPNRRAAALAAARSGEATLTAPIALVQTASQTRRGFLLLLPLYQFGSPRATPEQRWVATTGWSYSPLVIDKVLEGFDFRDGGIAITLSDRSSGAIPTVFYASSPGDSPAAEGLITQIPISVYGRRWQVEVKVLPPFVSRLNQRDPLWAAGIMAVVAALLSGLLYGFLLNIQRGRQSRAQQAQLAAIVESSNDAIIGKGLNGVVTSWNHAAERIFGYTAEQALGRPIGELIVPPELEAEETGIMARIGRGESVSNFSTLRHRSDGRPLDVAVTVSPIRAADGHIVGAAKTVRDITAQKWAEERFRLVVEAAPDALVMVDRDRGITLVNRKAEEMFGYTREEMLGQTIELLLPERFRDAHPRHVRGYAAERRPRPMGAGRDLFGLRKDGTEIPIEIGLTPVETADSLCILASIIDITERKRWETRIIELNATLEQQVADRTAQLRTYSALQRKNAERLRLATEAAGVGVWEFDLDTQHLTWDDSMFAIYGQNRASFSAAYDAWREHVVPEDLDSTETALKAAIAGTQPLNTSFRIRRGDGEERMIRAKGRVHCNAAGTPVRIIGTNEDITERTAAQAALQESATRLERANAELETARAHAEHMAQVKSEFLANMSHEIRTPMNAIIGLAYLLENGLVQGEALGLVKKIRIAGRSLLALINDILDFSKIEAGKLELERVPFRLGDLLENFAAVMSTSLGEKDIEFIVPPPPPGVDTLVGDPLRLEQVLINLVSNAFKFTESGEVVLAVQCVARTDPIVSLRISVRDTGIGISEDKQAEIFSAFSQADSSTTRRFGGTGLGLAISRELVHLMGGELMVISQPGTGSEFHFTLSFELGTEPGNALPMMTGLRVLIADDNPIAREVLDLTAQALHWEADVVESGSAALEQVVRHQALGRRYDLLLVDWKMPGLDGLGTVEAIRGTLPPETRSPVIIMVTAHARESLLQNPQARLLDGVITKPVTPSTLYDAVLVAQSRRYNTLGLSADTPVVESTAHRLPGVRVLVVDDSEINREVAQRILAGEGASVTTANDGESAVEWIRYRADEIDIVLMDVQMPSMDGHEATRQIRQLPQGRAIPIVALSAGAFTAQRDAALATGMNAYVAKPFNVDQLIATIQEQLGMDSPRLRNADLAEPGAARGPRNGTIPDAIAALPGLDATRGVMLWNDRQVYCRYLLSFSGSYHHAGDDIAGLLNGHRRDDAIAMAHKVAGAAANLAVMEVWRIAGLIDQSRESAAIDDLVSLARELQGALDVAVVSIQRFAEPSTEEPAPSDPAAADRTRAAPLLEELLRALDQDNPDVVEPIIASLADLLPHSMLEPIRQQVDTFDFRAAERHAKALAANLDLIIS